jgi:subtilisin family serine protease
VQVAAPGSGLISTVPFGDEAAPESSGYGPLSGTSMAAALVTGEAALIL